MHIVIKYFINFLLVGKRIIFVFKSFQYMFVYNIATNDRE